MPLEALVVRLAGRRVCPKDGRVYHIEFDPPKRPGVCDVDGTPLIQREDDKPAAIKRRLDNYFTQTEPLVDFYRSRGLLKEINGNQSVERVNSAIEHALSQAGVEPAGDRGTPR
jgi:adenylate kinase